MKLISNYYPVAEQVVAEVGGVGRRQPREADGPRGDVGEAGAARLQRH